MSALLDDVWAWIVAHQTALIVGGIMSLVSLLLAVFVLPPTVAKLPPDYFLHDHAERYRNRSPRERVVKVLKDILGFVLILLGILWIVLPGEGVLTILAGVLLADFPGKHQLMLRIVRIPSVHRLLDRMREKRGAAPLQLHRQRRPAHAGGS